MVRGPVDATSGLYAETRDAIDRLGATPCGERWTYDPHEVQDVLRSRLFSCPPPTRAVPISIRKHFFPSFSFGYAIALTLSLFRAAPAVSAPMDAAEPPALVFAFSELAPWKVKEGANGSEYGGVHTAIVRELARRVGRRLEIIECPQKRCLLLMQTGQAVLIIGMIQTPEREVYMKFLNTPNRIHSADRVFYVRAGEAARIKRYSDLSGLTIGTVNGSVYFKRFDDDTRLTKEVAHDNVANLHKLLLHRVDAVAIAEDQAAALVSELHLQSQLEPAKLHIPDPATRAVAVSKQSKAIALLPELEKAMHDMRSDGTLAALYDQHYYKRYGLSRREIKVD